MPRLSFTLRDVFWLTLVMGMGVGWSVADRQWQSRLKEEEEIWIWQTTAEMIKRFKAEDELQKLRRPIGQP
jgi:hypothetical protein